MPGPIVHLLNIQALPAYLRKQESKRALALAALLNKEPCSPYAGFGAQGPDFLVFSLKEYGTPLDEFVNFLFGVYDALEPFIEFYEAVVEPVEAAIDDAVTTLDKALFQGLIGDIGATADAISSALLAYLEKLATSGVDLFYPFYPKLQQGEPENHWYWFDTWHYRRTGRFASTLWKLAQGDDDLMRYAVGYGSHIGGDVAGHPFVNAIVGGPYRSHWHRHHLVENWIDAYARRYFGDTPRTKKCLRIKPEDTYLADAISGSYYYRLTEFPGGQLPGKLADLLVKAVDDTFAGATVPPALSAADFDTTYRLWQEWFERATRIGSAVKPTPVPPPGSATATLFGSYASGFPSPPGGAGGGGGGGGGFSIWGIFAAIAGFVKWLIDALAYTVKWIITNIDDIFLLPVTEALGLVKWLLYQIRKFVWQIYDESRFALVLGAYLSPEPRDFARYPWGSAFINTSGAHLTGGPAPSFSGYPRKQEAHGLFGPTEHHLLYPGTLREYPFAEAAPMPFYGANPEIVIGGWYPYDPAVDALYTATEPYGTGAQYTHWTDQNTWSAHQFGSIPAFTARLLAKHIDDLPNFNLDADRGHGWKTWEPDKPDIDKQNPVPVHYIDP
ncbi:MAG: hypothetical protein ACOYEV_09790 [Candidatus Nanopelagicales bacterium]